MSTKSLSHCLVPNPRCVPEGWNEDFPEETKDVVLDGYSAFSLDDAQKAGELLIDAHGEVRIKPSLSTEGCSQLVVQDRYKLKEALMCIDPKEITTYGVVLEQNLRQVVTYSVGTVAVARTTISYLGVQHFAPWGADPEKLYVGSDLACVRGSMEELLSLLPTEYVPASQVPAQRVVD